MNAGAEVHAREALGDWYAALALFRSDAHNALTAVALSLQRAADWLAQQQQFWRGEVRKAEEVVVTARTALRNKQFQDWSGRHPDTTVEEKDLQRALDRLR